MNDGDTTALAPARPETMRAWRVHDLGEPGEVLRLDDVPVPTASTGDVRLEVRACGLNFADILMCRGTYQEHPSLPFIPGTEIVGRVLEASPGSGSDRHAIGETLPPGTRVLALVAPPAGGLAEQTVVPADRLLPIPDSLDDATGAALQVTYQTAWFALHRRAALRAGETVLVHAGAGGTGSATIQLAVAAGARVIATAGGPEKVDICREHGADVVIDYLSTDFAPAVLDATDGGGADVIVDPVGGDTFRASTRCIAFEGRLIVVGFASGDQAELSTGHVFVKNYGVLGVHWPLYASRHPDLLREVHDELVELHAEGVIHPAVSAVRPLPEASEALDELAGRQTTGKIVIRP